MHPLVEEYIDRLFDYFNKYFLESKIFVWNNNNSEIEILSRNYFLTYGNIEKYIGKDPNEFLCTTIYNIFKLIYGVDSLDDLFENISDMLNDYWSLYREIFDNDNKIACIEPVVYIDSQYVYGVSSASIIIPKMHDLKAIQIGNNDEVINLYDPDTGVNIYKITTFADIFVYIALVSDILRQEKKSLTLKFID